MKNIDGLINLIRKIIYPPNPDRKITIAECISQEKLQTTARMLRIPIEEVSGMAQERVLELFKIIDPLVAQKNIQRTSEELRISVEELKTMRYDKLLSVFIKKERVEECLLDNGMSLIIRSLGTTEDKMKEMSYEKLFSRLSELGFIVDLHKIQFEESFTEITVMKTKRSRAKKEDWFDKYEPKKTQQKRSLFFS